MLVILLRMYILTKPKLMTKYIGFNDHGVLKSEQCARRASI